MSSPNTPRRAVVFGCGGHGKVVADILIASRGLTVVGFVDDAVPVGRSIMGLPCLGGEEWLRANCSGGIAIALGIGNNGHRESVARRCVELGLELLTAVHPSAVISPSAELGAGAVVMAASVVNADATIGRGVIVNTGAVVEHDCEVGDYAHLSPHSTMGGAAAVGAHAHLGIGAAVLPGIRVGAAAIAGAGAVVTKDVAAGVTVVGVPAKPLTRKV